MKISVKTALLFLLLCPALSWAQTNKSLAKVNMFAGKEVYYNSDPVNKYTVVYSINTVLPAPSITEKFNASFVVNYIINKANDTAAKVKKPFDAIITIEGSSKDIAVKFNEPVDSSKQRLTNVRRCGDKYIFVLCEPVNPYEVVFEIISKPKFPVSIVETVMRKAMRKGIFHKKKKPFDAIIIGSDKTHFAIKFKEA